MSGRRAIAPLVALLAAGLTAGPAQAGKPEIIRESFTFTIQDGFLSDACGVPVTSTVTGRTTSRTFDRSGSGLLEVFTINSTIVATSGGNTFNFKNVGADVTRRTADGRTIIKISGQVPFEFKGSQVIDAVTQEVLRAAQRRVSTERACAALTA